MAKFQLWSRDEYGQGSILVTSEKIEEVVQRAKDEVSDINVNNSLAEDDREKNWEAYFPVVSSKKSTKNTSFFYGGKGALNKHVFFSIQNKTGEVQEISADEAKNLDIKIYLGNVSANRKNIKEWFAADSRGKIITSISSPVLSDKTMFFIKAI